MLPVLRDRMATANAGPTPVKYVNNLIARSIPFSDKPSGCARLSKACDVANSISKASFSFIFFQS